MHKFDEKKQVQDINKALSLRKDIEKLAQKIMDKKPKAIHLIGIGGTYASMWQAKIMTQSRSRLPFYLVHAAEFCAAPTPLLDKDSVVIFCSESGSTQEVLDAVIIAKERGALCLGFVDTINSPLHIICHDCVSFKAPNIEQIKLFMLLDCLLHLNGEFLEYEKYYKELDASLAKGLVVVSKKADSFALDFAQKHRKNAFTYFAGSGVLWPGVYSYAMCYWEEQHWLRSKSVHASEFLHGTLEVIEESTPVVLFLGEDEQREIGLRVGNLLSRICANYEIIDSANYEIEGISKEFRGRLISFLIMRQITDRIDAHIERLNCHPMEIRRYYRRIDY